MPHQFLIVEPAGDGVLSITLNRPEVLNSVHTPMAAELQAVLAEAGASASVRAVLLTGAGRGFCAGQDLAEADPPDGEPLRDFAAHVRKVYNPVVRALRTLEKPVVAAVNGVAAGAGANLALACDFVVAASSATFVQAFIRIGLVPDTGGTYFLPRQVGLARATAMMMLGDRVTADEALAAGMIYRVVAPDRLPEEARALAVRLAACPTVGLGLTKRLLNASLTADLHTQLELEADVQGAAGRTEDYAEGVRAFREKRPPVFRGR
jgi:2-(1,2-epoxy-1,2-dihydrophenyl)acetyl-CoA isomerase